MGEKVASYCVKRMMTRKMWTRAREPELEILLKKKIIFNNFRRWTKPDLRKQKFKQEFFIWNTLLAYVELKIATFFDRFFSLPEYLPSNIFFYNTHFRAVIKRNQVSQICACLLFYSWYYTNGALAELLWHSWTMLDHFRRSSVGMAVANRVLSSNEKNN